MAGRAPFLPEKISRYVYDHSVREPEILRELRAATAAVPMSGMQIGADQGQFMGLLVQAIGARRCLEIGTYTGYSALAVALALDQLRGPNRSRCPRLRAHCWTIGVPGIPRDGALPPSQALTVAPTSANSPSCTTPSAFRPST